MKSKNFNKIRPFVNTVLNTVYHPRSDRKVYLHTSESIESNNSLQYRANPNFPKINLNSQFTSWNNGNIYLDEEYFIFYTLGLGKLSRLLSMKEVPVVQII